LDTIESRDSKSEADIAHWIGVAIIAKQEKLSPWAAQM
jgi:hypothetical protein